MSHTKLSLGEEKNDNGIVAKLMLEKIMGLTGIEKIVGLR